MRDATWVKSLTVTGVAVIVCVALLLVARFHNQLGTNIGNQPISKPKDLAPQCGHYAVVTTAELLGIPVTLNDVIDQIPAGQDGISFAEMQRYFTSLGLRSVGINLAYGSLLTCQLPVIVHMEPDHWDVIAAFNSDGSLTIYDNGERRIMTSRTFQKKWSGSALLVSRDRVDEAPPDSSKVHRIQFDSLIQVAGSAAGSDGPADVRFNFRNAGGAVLKLDSIVGDCQCLKIDCPGMAVPPGGSGSILIRYRQAPEPRSAEHSVLVACNDPSTHQIKLLVETGNPNRVEGRYPEQIDLGDVVSGGEANIAVVVAGEAESAPWDGRVEVRADAGLSMVTTIGNDPERTSSDATILPSKHLVSRIMVVTAWSTQSSTGPRYGSIRIWPHRDDAAFIDIPVRIVITSPICVRPSIIYVGEGAQSVVQRVEVSMESRDSEPFRTLSAEITGVNLKVEGLPEEGTGGILSLVGNPDGSPPVPFRENVRYYVA